MLLRSWALVSGAPLGVLAALAASPAISAPLLAGGALAGALVALVALVGVSRRGPGAPDQRAHLARGLSAGWAALAPVLGCAFGLGPGPLPLAIACALWLGVSLWRRSGSDAPAPGVLRHGLGILGELALGSALAIVAGLGWAALDGTEAQLSEELRSGVLDIDSRVALAPPGCVPRVAHIDQLAQRGAAPRLDADGVRIWFEARADDGRMQVHFVQRETREINCWTCGEPGNNRRPSPHPTGAAILFDSDRFASWREPANTEVMAVDARGEAPRRAARRLTSHRGRDDHASYDPAGGGFAWSRDEGGHFRLMRASILSGHGGLILSELQELARGGASFVRLAAWSPDARSLAVVRGHRFDSWRGELLDPATGARDLLADQLAPGPSVSFSADGAQIAAAETATLRAGALVPRALGFLVARLPERLAPPELHRGSVVRLGPTRGELARLDLGEDADWGAPTGIALARDARAFALGQRNGDAERLLWVELDCADATR